MMISPHGQLLAERLGFALLHSCWQIALIGLLTWVMLKVLHCYPAHVRYALASAAFAAMLVVPLLTLCLRQGGSPTTTTVMAASLSASAIVEADTLAKPDLGHGFAFHVFQAGRRTLAAGTRLPVPNSPCQ